MEYSKDMEDKLRLELTNVLPKINHKKKFDLEEDELIFKNFTEYLAQRKFESILADSSSFGNHRNDDKTPFFIPTHPQFKISQNEETPIFDSDSPITMGSSIGSSDDENLEDEEVLSMNHPHSSHKKFKKLTFKDVERSLDFYENDENKCLNELDILITFLKGQNHLYSLSHYLTQQKINCLTIPSFFLSIVVTVLAPLIHNYIWSGIVISAMTATIATLFGCVQFYGLDSACTNYLYLTNNYNKIQVSLETVSNSLVLGTGKIQGMAWKDVLDKIRDVEEKINDLKDINSLLPPEEVKLLIPIISHVNIFSFIKKMKTMKKNKILKYMEIKNEMRFILNHWEDEISEIEPISTSVKVIDIDRENNSSRENNKEYTGFEKIKWKKKRRQRMREKHRMNYLLKQKAKIRKELNYYHTAYSYMDEIFTREINLADSTSNWWVLLRWFLGIQPDCLPKNNPVVDKYLEFFFIQTISSRKEMAIEKNDSLKEDLSHAYFVEDDDEMV